MNTKVNLDQQFKRFHDHWSPRIVATVNDYDIKLVKVQGEFVWHHDQETRVLLLELQDTVNTGDAARVGTVGERLS
jgi:hypothetical protein